MANIGWGRFYLINYLTFPEGTQVPSFTGECTPEQRKALEKADRWLSRSVGEMPTPAGDMSETVEKSVTVEPGQTVTVADLTGPAQITALRVRGDFEQLERDRQIRALRELTLQMTWDDADAPAVWSPLGDFFGYAWYNPTLFARPWHAQSYSENNAGHQSVMRLQVADNVPFQKSFDGYLEKYLSNDLPTRYALVHQELSLVPSMSVADNLFLGQLSGWVSARDLRQRVEQALRRVGLSVSPHRIVGELQIATQQLIEIAKALRHEARVLIMDESTIALDRLDAERLFGLIDQLRRDGMAVVYISHKMEEVRRLADRITVLRDGRRVGSARAEEMPTDELIRLMVGRPITHTDRRAGVGVGEEALRVASYSVRRNQRGGRPAVEGVGFSVKRGEVLGIAGLEGSGKSELLLGLFGASGWRGEGEVMVRGERVDLRSPREALRRGVALLTNDRKATGLVLDMSVTANTTMADLPRLARAGWRSASAERNATRRRADQFGLRARSLDMAVGLLSGGNQQKVALAQWLQTDPRILLLDEPTRGVDIGAKQDIYRLIERWTEAGMAVVLISSELPELLSLSDRVLVLHRGKLAEEISRDAATPERVLAAAMGQESRGVAA